MQKSRKKQVGGNHYISFAIQPWDIIDCYSLGFYAGNAIKYILRTKESEKRKEDLEKAIHYLEAEIERLAIRSEEPEHKTEY